MGILLLATILALLFAGIGSAPDEIIDGLCWLLVLLFALNLLI